MQTSTDSAGNVKMSCIDKTFPVGNVSCPCIPSLAAFGVLLNGSLISASIDGISFELQDDFGQFGCAAHDALTTPACGVVLPTDDRDELEVTLPVWCFQPWCYVNATVCASSPFSTSPATYGYNFWRESAKAELHYSYATCDTPDLYTSEYEKKQAAREEYLEREQLMADLVRVFFGLGMCFLVLLLGVGAFFDLRRRRRQRKQLRKRIRLTSNDKFARAVECEGRRYNIFLSHAWQSGQDQVLCQARTADMLCCRHALLPLFCFSLSVGYSSLSRQTHFIKERLLLMQPDLRLFLDVDDLDQGRGSEYVDQSNHILAFITAGYTDSPNCIRELLRAILTRKPVTLMLESMPTKGGMNWAQVEAGLAAALANLKRWGLDDELRRWHEAGETPVAIPTLAMLTAKLTASEPLLYCRLKLFLDPTLRMLAERQIKLPKSKSKAKLRMARVRDSCTAARRLSIRGVAAPATAAAPAAVPATAAAAATAAAPAMPLGVNGVPRSTSAPVAAQRAWIACQESQVISAAAPSEPADGAEQSCLSTERKGCSKQTSGGRRRSRFSLRRDGAPDMADEEGDEETPKPRGAVVSETYLPSEIVRNRFVLPEPRGKRDFHVYVSKCNEGAAELVAEVGAAHGLQIATTSDPDLILACEFFMLYLNGQTWTGPSSAEFASEVELALQADMQLLLCHEEAGLDDDARHAVPFDSFFVCELGATPRKLITAGVYNKIALPLQGGMLRATSLAIVATVLCALREKLPIGLRAAKKKSAMKSLTQTLKEAQGRVASIKDEVADATKDGVVKAKRSLDATKDGVLKAQGCVASVTDEFADATKEGVLKARRSLTFAAGTKNDSQASVAEPSLVHSSSGSPTALLRKTTLARAMTGSIAYGGNVASNMGSSVKNLLPLERVKSSGGALFGVVRKASLVNEFKAKLIKLQLDPAIMRGLKLTIPPRPMMIAPPVAASADPTAAPPSEALAASRIQSRFRKLQKRKLGTTGEGEGESAAASVFDL